MRRPRSCAASRESEPPRGQLEERLSLALPTLGTHARLEIQRGSGDKECLLDIPRWDFDWQDSYVFTQLTQ